MSIYLGLDTSQAKLDLNKLKVNLNKAKNLTHQWIPNEFRHVPLCTLNDHNNQISDLITNLVLIHQPFVLSLAGVWAFPDQSKARLLWVGVQNAKELRALQTDLSKRLAPFMAAEVDDKEFRPYLPVVRLRNHREVSDILSPHKNSDFGKITAEKLILLKMTSGGPFPTYHKIQEFKLGV